MLPPARWAVAAAADPAATRALAAELRIPEPLAALLVQRGFSSAAVAKAFLRPDLERLSDPLIWADMRLAVDLLARAVRERRAILVHGDYDVDGQCGAALLTRVLREAGATVHAFVPHRLRDGYDFGPAALAAAQRVGAGVIVTCDCGITAVDAVAAARAAGMEVIVTDHHIPGDTLPHGGADCSITLGTGSTSPLDMATGYATLANDGVYCPYYAVERIVGPGGKTVYQHDPTSQCHQVVKHDIALQVTDMLKGVVAHGTGWRANIGRPQAGKTGTNEEYKDAWFCGYVPQLATAVWVGYPGIPKPMYNVEGFSHMFGGDIPAEEWHDVMSAFVRGMPAKDWPPPPPPPQGTVPDVVGKTQDEAIKILADANFDGQVTGEAPSTLPEGTVISQSPGGGSTVDLGSLISLIISNGQPPKAQVPNVVGLPEQAARSVLSGAGFQISVSEVPVADPSQDGLVLQQSPAPGSEVLAGATVSITVGRFTLPSPPPTVPPPPTPTPSPPGERPR